MSIEKLLKYEPFDHAKVKKFSVIKNTVKLLTFHHFKFCKEYKKIIVNLKIDITKIKKVENFPMLPVRLFKKFELKSVKNKNVVKQLVSSGTSGKELSKIYLDKKNAKNQVKVLSRIMTYLIGNKRLPMLIIDQDPKLPKNNFFNARSAAIYGFSIFGKNHCFLLDRNGKIDYQTLNNFLKEFGGEKFLIFGFTSYVYDNLIKKISLKLVNSSLKNGLLLHGGGWKKLENIKISNKKFKNNLNKKFKLKKVYNYYGLVEQTGSIFIESEKCGYFHTSIFSDIFIRDINFNILKNKKRGLIQLISLLPKSYPGHNILTEDMGEIVGEDDCKCGLKGKYFLVHGRAKEAEIRGCSDVE